MNRSTFLVASVLMLCLVAPVAFSQDFFFDDFDDNILDATNWLSTTPSGSISETNQRMEFRNRGYLTTSNEYDPLSVGGLDISGTWTNVSGTAGVNRDFLQVLTRSDGLVADRFRETANGIEFFALPGNSGSNGQLRIVERVNGVANTLASTPVNYSIGDTIDFSILDDGDNLSFSVVPQGSSTPVTLTTSNSRVYGTNRVVFHNRENNNSANTFSYLDDVTIASLESARSPMRGNRSDRELALDATANNLVLITHGWANSDVVDPNTGTWVDTMASAIESRVSDDWKVVPYKWIEEATTGDIYEGEVAARAAVAAARSLALVEGPGIANKKYEHVHLIAHSAGGAFIDQLSRTIKRLSPETTVHLTFLDAYLPDQSYVNEFGKKADFVEQYFTTDISFNTQHPLLNGHNIDISSLDGIDDHSFPYEWYQRTIEATEQDSDWLRYGARLSLEAGKITSWSADSLQLGFPHGTTCSIPSGKCKKVSSAEEVTTSVGLSDIQPSPTGEVAVNANTVTMKIGSPVWFTTTIESTLGIDFLQFDAAFTGNGDGYLTVLIDDEIVVGIDQRYAGDQVTSYWIPFSAVGSGEHLLAFRLDDYLDMEASVVLNNIEFGKSIVVPEPASASLFLFGSVVLCWRRIRTCKFVSQAS